MLLSKQWLNMRTAIIGWKIVLSVKQWLTGDAKGGGGGGGGGLEWGADMLDRKSSGHL